MQIHELNTLAGIPGETDFLAIDTGFDTAKISAPELLKPVKEQADNLGAKKVDLPLDEHYDPDYGTAGQLLRTKGDGSTEWADVGLPTDEQTETAINKWLDDHPEATTTVADGSLTEAKFSNALKAKAIKDYVTPEMFGAAGDGVTDDTLSLQAALDYAETNSVRFVADKTYKTTSTITIRCDAEINGIIVYAGSGTAILVGYLTSTNLSNVTVKIRVKSDSFVDDPASIGVYFGNTYMSVITIDWVEGFYNGVIFGSYGKGNAYNAVYLNVILNFKIGLTLISNNNGWVNENSFYNGTIRCESSFVYYHDDIFILIDSTRNYENNNNRFYNQCLEGAKTAIKIKHGDYNTFYGIRTEGAETVLDTETGMLNFVEVTYGPTTNVNSGPPNFTTWLRRKAQSLLNYLVGDTGFLGREVAYNGNYASYKWFGSISGNTESYRSVAGISDKGLNVASNRNCYFTVDFPNDSQKLLAVKADLDWSGGRIVYLMLDKDGNDVVVPPKSIEKGSSFGTSTTTVSGHTAYVTQSDNPTGDFSIIQLPSNVRKVLISLYQTAHTDWYLKSIKIYSDHVGTMVTTVSDYPVLASIPTSTGYDGQFVRAKTPTSSCIGWIYFNNTWNVVPL